MATSPKKKALLAKVHIAKKDLCLDDGTYRDLLTRVTGKDSASKMLISELEAVIFEFGNRGWKPKPTVNSAKKHGKKPRVADSAPNRQASMDKIGAILADMSLPWAYAHSTARNMFGKEKLDFCDDLELSKVKQALAVYQYRQNKKVKQ